MTVTFDDRRVDQVQVTTGTRGTVSIDNMKRTLEQGGNVLGRIANRCRRANKDRLAAVHLANSQQSSHDAPMDFNIVGTNVWDYRLNSWQNYYNHGIEIQGKSLNPPNEYFGIYKGKQIHLIETAKNTAIDADGDTWTFDKIWIKDFIYKGKIVDPKSSHGYDRDHVKFNIYQEKQELLANSFIEKYYKTSVSHEQSFAEINNIVSHEYPDTIPRHLDPELQVKMSEEATKAEKYLKEMYAKMYPGMIFDE